MQFSVGEGLRRAVKNRLRSGNKGSEKRISIGGHKNWRGSMRPMSTTTPLKLVRTCSTKRDGQTFIKEQLSARTSPGFIAAPIGAEAKPSAKGGRAKSGELHRIPAEPLTNLWLRTRDRRKKNGARDAPETEDRGIRTIAEISEWPRIEQIAANRRNGSLGRRAKNFRQKPLNTKNRFKHVLSIGVSRYKRDAGTIGVPARTRAPPKSGNVLGQARAAAEAELQLVLLLEHVMKGVFSG